MGREYHFYVYMMTSDSGTLYVGITKSLKRRVWEHKQSMIDGFTKKYKCYKLVYYEHYSDVYCAINREKQLKNWNREKKENLIKTMNSSWVDLWDGLF